MTSGRRSSPHYLRVATALATVVAPGCYQSVAPADGAIIATDARDVTGDSSPDANATQCPPSPPVTGSTCSIPDLRCTYPPAHCDDTFLCNGVLMMWEADCIAGPLAPPEMPA